MFFSPKQGLDTMDRIKPAVLRGCVREYVKLLEMTIAAWAFGHLLQYVGWVNLYQQFEIEKYTVCGKLILPKKWKDIF